MRWDTLARCGTCSHMQSCSIWEGILWRGVVLRSHIQLCRVCNGVGWRTGICGAGTKNWKSLCLLKILRINSLLLLPLTHSHTSKKIYKKIRKKGFEPSPTNLTAYKSSMVNIDDYADHRWLSVSCLELVLGWNFKQIYNKIININRPLTYSIY